MADLYNPLAGVRGTGITYNDLLASRPDTRDAFAQQLMQMLSGLKLNAPAAPPPVDPNMDPSMGPQVPSSYQADILDQLFGAGNYHVYQSQDLLNQPVYLFDSGQLRDPYQSNNHVGRWVGQIDANGNLTGLQWKNDSTTSSLVDRIGNFATDWGPALVLAAATAGAGGLAGLGGGASAAPAAQGGGYFGGLSAGAGGQTGLTLGAGGVTGATAPAGFVLAPEIGASLGAAGAGAAAADGGYFGGLDPAAGGQGLQMPGAASVEGMGGGQGLVATQAPVAPQVGSIVGPTGTSGIAESLRTAYDAVKPYASLIGPAMSLLSAGQQMPQMPQNAGARIPGVEAPPEARGYQPASAPILDVLGRNRRENRNRTLLTGPGGVNMDSVRVGGNTLLGM